jgi:hypothetical protein
MSGVAVDVTGEEELPRGGVVTEALAGPVNDDGVWGVGI